MPKIKTFKTAAQELADAIKARAYINCGGLVGLAKPLGCSPGTVYNRIKEPEKLSIDDLHKIKVAADMSREEVLALIAPMI